MLQCENGKKKAGSSTDEPLTWLHNHPLLKQHSSNGRVDRHVSLTDVCWPYYLDFYSEIPPLHLFSVDELESLGSQSEWLVRDGLVPLMRFFGKFPSPGALKARLYIDSRWHNAIPASWASQVRFWELVKIGPPDLITSVFFSGLVMPTALNADEWEAAQVDVLNSFANRSRQIKKYAYLPVRFLSGKPDPLFHFRFMKGLFSRFGTDIAPLDHPGLMRMSSMSPFLLVNFMAKTLLSDDYVTSLVLSKGGSVHGIRQVADRKMVSFAASPFHGYVLTAQPKQMVSRDRFKQILKKTVNSPTYLHLNWNSYFGMTNPT